MGSREQRIAANEALFRDANERIVRKDAAQTGPLEILCECGDAECLERISLSPAEYETIYHQDQQELALVGATQPGLH